MSPRSKNVREHLNEPVVVENRLGPAAAGAEDVAVREAARSGEPLEFGEVRAPFEEVRHMNVVDVEARTRKGCSHFRLRIDAFFAQHAHLGTSARSNEGRRHVLIDIVGRLRKETGIGRIGDAGEFLVCVGGIVAAARNFMRNLAPGFLKLHAREGGNRLALVLEAELIGLDRFADEVRAVRKPFGAHLGHHLFDAVRPHLENAAELFVEERIEHRRILLLQKRIERSADADAGSEVHFSERRKEAAVAFVVIGKNAAGKLKLAKREHEARKKRRIVYVGGFVAEALRNLRENRAAMRLRPSPRST